MYRTILHVDANCFYISVETALNPQLANKPAAVVGDAEKRHGIVLTANYIAKRVYGVKTGDTVWQAEKKCPGLVKVTAHMQLYKEYSMKMRDILYLYSDYVEPFGCDEAWIELKGIVKDNGEKVAHHIRKRIKKELGITVSVGVSFNKAFAKLGSDMKKPDAVTVISEENFKEKIWPLPVEDLLYVGRKTKTLLNKKAIYTIGDLAGTDITLLNDWLGKSAHMLHDYANGLDNSQVMHYDCKREFKSIGNSTTFPYDLTTEPQVRSSLVFLADYVSQRLRNEGVKGREITVSVRDNKMHWVSHRRSIECPTDISNEIAHHAMELFKESYGWIYPVRSLGISVGRLGNEDFCVQLDLLSDEEKRSKQHIIDTTGDMLRKKFGDTIICKAVTLMNKDVAHM